MNHISPGKWETLPPAFVPGSDQRGHDWLVTVISPTAVVAVARGDTLARAEIHGRTIAALPEILERLKKHLTWSETFFKYEGLSHDGPLQSDILETKDLIAKLEGRL